MDFPKTTHFPEKLLSSQNWYTVCLPLNLGAILTHVQNTRVYNEGLYKEVYKHKEGLYKYCGAKKFAKP